MEETTEKRVQWPEYDFSVNVAGGLGQAEAIRLGISRHWLNLNTDLHRLRRKILTRDAASWNEEIRKAKSQKRASSSANVNGLFFNRQQKDLAENSIL